MPKAATKPMRVNARNREYNKMYRSEMRTRVKRVRKLISHRPKFLAIPLQLDQRLLQRAFLSVGLALAAAFSSLPSCALWRLGAGGDGVGRLLGCGADSFQGFCDHRQECQAWHPAQEHCCPHEVAAPPQGERTRRRHRRRHRRRAAAASMVAVVPALHIDGIPCLLCPAFSGGRASAAHATASAPAPTLSHHTDGSAPRSLAGQGARGRCPGRPGRPGRGVGCLP